MINYLKGKIIFKDEKKIILVNNDIGFKIFLSFKNLENIKEGTEEEVFTDIVLKEKEMEMYGFLSLNELELYSELKNISGVGPKTALLFADAGSFEKLKFNLENGIEIPKGIGSKKLQKILLDLTGKIKEVGKNIKKEDEEIYLALRELGFSTNEIKEALNNIPKKTETIEDKIKETLKNLGR